MDILWWIASGTYNKMESDIGNAFPGQAYWTREEKQGEVPLQIDNLILWFFILGFSHLISLVVFFVEIIFSKFSTTYQEDESSQNEFPQVMTYSSYDLDLNHRYYTNFHQNQLWSYEITGNEIKNH